MKNDADVMSAVSDIRSPAAATSNFRSLVTAASSDQKKAKRQAHDKKKTDPKKLKKQTSETAGHSVCLPKGDDDHNDFNDLDFIGREGQCQTAHHQYSTRQAAAGMTPTQLNKDQEASGVAEQTSWPTKGGKTTKRCQDDQSG